MTQTHRRLCALALAAAGIGAAPVVLAQSTAPVDQSSSTRSSGGMSASGDGYSILPFTRRGYWGVSLGQSNYKNPCGSALFSCDDSDLSGRIYTGGMFNDWLGLEAAYVNMGKVDRAGGSTDTHGINLSLVGRVPLGQFNAFAKAGTTYSRTEVSSAALSGVASGSEKGWGGSYGLGVGWDFTSSSGLVLEWERHDIRFPGDVKDPVESATIGYIQRF